MAEYLNRNISIGLLLQRSSKLQFLSLRTVKAKNGNKNVKQRKLSSFVTSFFC